MFKQIWKRNLQTNEYYRIASYILYNEFILSELPFQHCTHFTINSRCFFFSSFFVFLSYVNDWQCDKNDENKTNNSHTKKTRQNRNFAGSIKKLMDGRHGARKHTFIENMICWNRYLCILFFSLLSVLCHLVCDSGRCCF